MPSLLVLGMGKTIADFIDETVATFWNFGRNYAVRPQRVSAFNSLYEDNSASGTNYGHSVRFVRD